MPDTACPSCATPVEFPPELAGKKFSCMKCDHEFRLPGDPSAPADPARLQTAPTERRPGAQQISPEPTSAAEDKSIYSAGFKLAAEMMVQGQSQAEIIKALTDSGYSAKDAAFIFQHMWQAMANVTSKQAGAAVPFDINAAQRKAAMTNILFGALWLFGGLIVTLGSYAAAASSEGGGRYVVTGGAIIFGVIQLFRGIGQLSGK